MVAHRDSNYLLGLRFENHHQMFSGLLGDTQDTTLRKYQGDIDDLLTDLVLVAERLKARNPADAISCKDGQLQLAREIAFRSLRKQALRDYDDDHEIVKNTHASYLAGKLDYDRVIKDILIFVEEWDSNQVPDTSERNKAVKFTYTNYRGETSIRNAIIFGTRWGNTEWHPEPGMLMKAFDLDKFEIREFALKDCDFTTTE